jgi:hypothetical protein
MEVLTGHNSFETAYEIQDYPYGFRLRCKMRVWIEEHATRGARFVSCTSNPKVEGLRWNKPKAGVYAKYGVVLFLNPIHGHVEHVGVSEYSDVQELLRFRDTYGAGLPPARLEKLQTLIDHKIRYEEKRARGLTTPEAIAEMRLEDVRAAQAAKGVSNE